MEAVAKEPLHVDLSVASRRAESERLVGLGATVNQDFDDHAWLLDPEGNDFCVTGEWERTWRLPTRGSSVPWAISAWA